ncbi:ABC transporter permease [Streptomyces sp. NPDC048182]|uniref:ABC transporter permease n=1 Tax=unclassified Streptomyces TaxID=2593676 RepID=UPI00339FCE4D
MSGNPSPAGPSTAGTSRLARTSTLVAVGLVALQAVMVILLAWPNARLAPRDVPIAVAGPAQATAGLRQTLEKRAPDAFEVHVVADEAAARGEIHDREVYGALVVGAGAPKLLTASAASVPVSQLLTALAGEAAQGQPVKVEDVVAAPEGDPRGTGYAAGFLPLIMTAMAGGILLTVAVRAVSWQLSGAVVFALLAGLGSTALFQGWIDVIDGPYLLNSLALSLMMLAISGTIIGAHAVFGVAGTVTGAFLMFLVGNPLSGAAAGPEMLPQPWGTFGQYLPPGAGSHLLRSVAFFDGNDVAHPLTVLFGWVVLAGLLAATGLWLRRESEAPAAPAGGTEGSGVPRPVSSRPPAGDSRV